MTPKLLNEGYKPSSRPVGDPANIQNGYRPTTGGNTLPPPPPPNTGSSVVKPKE